MTRRPCSLISAFVVAIAIASTTAIARAQLPASPAPSATIAADPGDVATPDAIIGALYDVISGAGPSLEAGGFFEREIGRRSERFGNVTHAFSAYESRRKADDGKPFARGIDSIQLYHDGTRWWVVTVFWDSERADNPIPSRYIGP